MHFRRFTSTLQRLDRAALSSQDALVRSAHLDDHLDKCHVFYSLPWYHYFAISCEPSCVPFPRIDLLTMNLIIPDNDSQVSQLQLPILLRLLRTSEDVLLSALDSAFERSVEGAL